jgi:hypothetical protein
LEDSQTATVWRAGRVCGDLLPVPALALLSSWQIGVCAGYRPDAKDRFFQYLISASVEETSKASRPLANGARIPSIADEVFAEIQSRASAFAAVRRNRFDLASFMRCILRLIVVTDARRMGKKCAGRAGNVT